MLTETKICMEIRRKAILSLYVPWFKIRAKWTQAICMVSVQLSLAFYCNGKRHKPCLQGKVPSSDPGSWL